MSDLVLEVAWVKTEIEREDDGRWVAEIPELPGVMVYGTSREEAIVKAEGLALRVNSDRIDSGEAVPDLDSLFAVSV
jgi:predicted RNase H-like HicB family nuclease